MVYLFLSFDEQEDCFLSKKDIRIGGGLIQKNATIPKTDTTALGIPFDQLRDYKFEVQLESTDANEASDTEENTVVVIVRMI